jgi:serine/threonine protein kinase
VITDEGRAFTFGPRIGEGGFGEVYRGSMCSVSGLETEVAIKILHRDLNPASQALQRLKDEGKLLARLNHPNILFVHDLVELGGRWALITEYIDGDDLSTLCDVQNPLSIRAVVDIVGRIASALDAAWSTTGKHGQLHLVHRDVKPSNIRISRHGHVKLLDFGIARADENREAHTKTNLVVGSPPFMAPERFLTDKCDCSSDTFSLGATLYESVTHERLFQDKSALNIATLALDALLFNEHITKRLAHPTLKNKNLRTLLSSMLAYTPSDRPGAAAVTRNCEDIAHELTGETLKQWSRQHKWTRVNPTDGPHSALRGQTFSERPAATSDTAAQSTRDAPTISLWLENATRHPFKVLGALLVVVLVTVLIGTGSGYTGLLLWKSLKQPQAQQIAPTSAQVEVIPPTITESPPVVATAQIKEPIKKSSRTNSRPTIQKTVDLNTPPSSTLEPPPETANLPPTAMVTSSAGFPLTLKLGSNEFSLPASVGFGTYDIFATFSGDKSQWAGVVTIDDIRAISINCSQKMRKCVPK